MNEEKIVSFLSGKRALIVGLASNRSIAYGIAQAFHQQGAELAFSYQNEKLQGRVQSMAEKFNASITLPCDVSSDEEITQLFVELGKHWDNVDIIVHSVAYAPADQFEDNYLHSVNREGFKLAHDISSYSFAALAKAGESLLTKGSSALLTLSYLGAERVVSNYNVMGVAKASLEANVRYMSNSLGPNGTRVNAISAGPIKTLAASGIKNFRKILNFNEKVAPLRQNVTIEQVGNAAAFLCSDLASGITGEILHVDGGIHAIALNPDD
jgi:enoyl-[acyl-carrier protein] reductase I